MFSRKKILPIIVIAQFCCVSLWFAGNGVMNSLIREFQLDEKFLGHLTSAVQLGFIIGTLFFAVLAFADRFSPSKVFFISAILAASSNFGLIISDGEIAVLYLSRFLTGFFIAGIYPVGMKISADYFDKDLGKALGYLLGALVLGTAFPHLLKSAMDTLPWESVIISISVIAVLGGLMVILFVPDGPFRKTGSRFDKSVLFKMFSIKSFRAAAFGYFGHMWELYAFWTFIPFVLASIVVHQNTSQKEISFLTFLIIGIGSIACVLGGYMSRIFGSYRVAFFALVCSGLCCLVSPLMFTLNPMIIFIFLFFWGMVVIMDSPQFSTLVAQSAPSENKGSALTIVNCIGFSITIISIQVLNLLLDEVYTEWLYFFLLPGPVLGLIAMWQWRERQAII